VVDTPEPNPIKGASLVLIDEDLNVASLCCYTEGPDPTSYRVRVEAPGAEASNDLVDQLRQDIDPAAEPWASLAQSVKATVDDRGRQLADRLRADASALDQLSGGGPHQLP
jgi:hypothetical protein